MRLIDADGLKNVIYESWGGDPYYHTSKGYPEKTETEIRAEAASLFLENIDAQPTIEAVPLEGYRSMEQTVYKLTQALAEAETVNNGRKPKVVTNADNLRSIQNDMQLAIFMGSVNACPYDRDDALFECEKWNGACDMCWLYWLKQEVEGDGTETLDEVEE